MIGHCHCHSVTWTLLQDVESVTACNCSLCSRYGALWAYGYLGYGVTTSGDTKSYTRDRQVLEFHFCINCGCLAYYLARSKDSEGRLKIAVNLRMVDDPGAIMNLEVEHFDGLNKFDDEPKDGRQVRDLWY